MAVGAVGNASARKLLALRTGLRDKLRPWTRFRKSTREQQRRGNAPRARQAIIIVSSRKLLLDITQDSRGDPAPTSMRKLALALVILAGLLGYLGLAVFKAGGRGRGRDTAWQLPSGLWVRFGSRTTSTPCRT